LILNVVQYDLGIKEYGTLVIPVVEDAEIYTHDLVNDVIKSAGNIKEFPKEKNETLILYDNETLKSDRIIFVSLGKIEKLTLDSIRDALGSIIKKCIKLKLEHIHVPVPQKLDIELNVTIKAMMEGTFLANYIFDRYKKEKKDSPLREISFMIDNPANFSDLIVNVETICTGTFMAREWVTTPAGDLTIDTFSNDIKFHAKTLPLAITDMSEDELKEKQFNALLAVAKGSAQKPKLLFLDYNPERAKKTVALVGKAVMFDSGGLNLKPSASIEDMKTDMAGGAVVAATILTAARLKLNLRIIAAIPMVENMPSGTATHPGDIVKSYCGKTIEIMNTDAEGRLILADALSYTIDIYKPEVVIDVATLTGACVVALGEKIAGMFSNDEAISNDIFESSNRTNERCWKMPMPEDYKELLKSELADMRNISTSKWGGAITAAIFLSEFIEETKWAHIDIAGPAHNTKESAYCPPGGTGFGVRLLTDFLSGMC